MNPNEVKEVLFSSIEKISKEPHNYCFKPDVDFSRRRKLSLDVMLKQIIKMGSYSLQNEMIDIFQNLSVSVSSSAFVQQRQKIKISAFENILSNFNKEISSKFSNKLRIIAIDGSDIHIPTNPNDKDSFFQNKKGQKPYNLLHLNALYDIENKIFTDILIQKRYNSNENNALVEMVDRSNIEKAIIIADRWYESFNNLAHIQEKGFFFLFRIKDGRCGIKSGLDLPQKEEFDVFFELNITRKQTNEVKKLCQDRNSYKYIPSDARFDYLQLKNRKAEVTVFYKLSFRIVRFKLSNNSYEVIITNLNKDEYPPARLKELYSSRWSIETSFRELKYTLGMLNFHTKKTICIYQEIYAHIIMYNFVSVITSHVIIDKNKCKYKYKANFSAAVHICRAFLKGNATSSDLEAVIANNIHPVRPDRHYVRIHTGKHSHSFTYRVA